MNVIMSIRYLDIWNSYLMAAILKIQMATILCICANVNINFQIPDATSFPKMCCFANLHKF